MPTKSLTVTYRKFNHLDEFTPTQLNKLAKLSYGQDGIMWYVVDNHKKGYLDPWFDGKYGPYNAHVAEMVRSIAVAYVGNVMVGWCVTDDEGKFNVYVANKYRNLGIAQTLTELWAADNVDKLKKVKKARRNRWGDEWGGVWNYVHTDEAAKLMNNAMRKLGINQKKLRKVTHKIIN